jgi:chaperone LolA
MKMKGLFSVKYACMALMMMLATTAFAQSDAQARKVLDKTAALIGRKGGASANFSISGAKIGATSGTIAIKGNKFHATTPQATVWYDGKTQWSYMKKTNEVNVTTPTLAKQTTMNPLTFINMYKKGFRYTMTQSAGAYQVHLTSTDSSKRVKEMFITVDKKTYHPTEVKLLQKQKWTTFTIKNMKTAKLSDAAFKFNSKDFPTAEVIDLR